jgi:hypothetical protein
MLAWDRASVTCCYQMLFDQDPMDTLSSNLNCSEQIEKFPVNHRSSVEYSEKVSCYLNYWLMI